jgi:stalled ribosome rescue protein Dom34
MRESRDLWFNTYLIYKGHEIVKFEVCDKRRVVCYFHMDEQEWMKLKIEFRNSEFAKFKSSMDQLRDMGF